MMLYFTCCAGKMGHLLRVVIGDWQRLGEGKWKFEVDPVSVKYDLVVKENETYESLVAMVREKYDVHPSTPVSLTYDFPDWMKVPGDSKNPPVDIFEDRDVELFMELRIDFADLRLRR